MAASKKPSSSPRRPPATTPEAREKQMIALAFDVAERQMREGTASSQIITQFLKLGTAREQLEREKLEHENRLLEARKTQIDAQGRIEELYHKAIKAMNSYKGYEVPDDPDD